MKSLLKKVINILLVFTIVLSATGCGKKQEKRDDTKTYLDVMYFDGGYGSAWLEKAAKEFEEMYKDYTIGNKTGVVIKLHGTRETGQNIFDKYELMTNEIFFTEQNVNYYNFVNKNYLLDLTDVLTEAPIKDAKGNVIQDHSILSVMSEDVTDWYGVGEGASKKYYSAPLASSFCGLIYDEEFFFNNGLFLTKNYDEKPQGTKVTADYLIGNITDKNADGEYYTVKTVGDKQYRVVTDKNGKEYTLSQGPDGKYGTYDDGQPRTYVEFFKLCGYMKNNKGIYPFNMYGEEGGYIDWFLDQLFADYEGYEQTMLNFSFEGKAKNLISVDEDGNVTKLDEVQMYPNPTKKEERGQNAEIVKSAGRYYALKFFEQMLEGDGGEWIYEDWTKGSSQFDAQRNFMQSIQEGADKIAFLIDGTWWQQESEKIGNFNSLAKKYGDKFKKKNRNFKYYSLPKASLDKVGEERVVMDTGYYSAYALNKIADEKKEIAAKFIQYCFTDAKNKEYTQITGVPRAFNYNFTDEEYKSLSSFGKSLWDMVKSGNARILYPQSKNRFYLNKVTTLQPSSFFFTTIENTRYENIQEVIGEKNISPEVAFSGIYNYFKSRYEVG